MNHWLEREPLIPIGTNSRALRKQNTRRWRNKIRKQPRKKENQFKLVSKIVIKTNLLIFPSPLFPMIRQFKGIFSIASHIFSRGSPQYIFKRTTTCPHFTILVNSIIWHDNNIIEKTRDCMELIKQTHVIYSDSL